MRPGMSWCWDTGTQYGSRCLSGQQLGGRCDSMGGGAQVGGGGPVTWGRPLVWGCGARIAAGALVRGSPGANFRELPPAPEFDGRLDNPKTNKRRGPPPVG